MDNVEKMRVKTYCINRGQTGQHFILVHADEGFVLPYVPNNWKTEKGAIRYALREGMEVVE